MNFWPLCDKHIDNIFDEDSIIFRWRQHISEQEKESLTVLAQNMGSPLKLYFAVFYQNEFVGWSYGFQQSADVYYMCNSAILPEHRGKGLYTALLNTKLQILKEKGFQKIYSRHNATNNAIIIPKLKAGFIITTMEVDDAFGTLVHLAYYTNPLRKKMMVFRVGDLRPDEAMEKMLGLNKK